MSDFPDFLEQGWFCPRNAGLLRYYIKARIHQLLAEQAPDQDAPAVQQLKRLAATELGKEMT